MKKGIFLLVSVVSCLLIFSSFASAESDRERILRMEKAYKDIVVVDTASCKERVGLEFSWAWAVAQSNQSSSSYYRTLEQYKRNDLDACYRDWN